MQEIVKLRIKRVAAKGYIRASMRDLDAERSREEYPFQSFKVSRKLKKGEIVPLDIAIWPMGMRFKKGEYLYITVNAYKTAEWASPFDLKMAKLRVPRDGFTYMPGEKPEMLTIGGVSGGLTGGIDTTQLPKDVNKGRHILYTGGKYDSYLYLPVVPEES